MPFKKYREHLIYKRLEKKVSTPPSSTSTSLQSVPLSTNISGSGSGINERINQESPFSSAQSSPSGPRLSKSFFTEGNSNRRPLSSLLLDNDDEYNAYSYGLVPLSERNIYREFSVIELPNSEKSGTMNTWSKKSSTSDFFQHHLTVSHQGRSSATLPTTSALKSPPSTSALHFTSAKNSLEREKKTVRIVVEGENGENNKSEKSETLINNKNDGSPKSNHIRSFSSSSSSSSFGKKGGSRGEFLIPICRETNGLSSIRSNSSISSNGSAGKSYHSKSIDSTAAMAMEPVPTPVRSYKCTSYTLNEIRSF